MATKYYTGKFLGEGTWGLVYEATRKADGSQVAIKKIKPMPQKELGMNFTALREVKYLKELKSINVVELIDVFLSNGELYLVLEYCPFDLENVIKAPSIILHTNHIKSYMKMILNGMEYLHHNFILHRDLKPANLLIGRDGQIKIADFGLARNHSSPENMTSEVVTRWYRPPELLFGATFYSSGVDMWSVGCIFAEIVLRIALFPGNSDIEQLGKIFNVLGTPNLEDWPGMNLLPNYVEFEPREPLDLSKIFSKPRDNSSSTGSALSSDLDLILKMLALNPAKRISASKALKHIYFHQDPQPCDPADLPVPPEKLSLMKIGAGALTKESPSTKRQRV
eukprot:gene2350-2497_t